MVSFHAFLFSILFVFAHDSVPFSRIFSSNSADVDYDEAPPVFQDSSYCQSLVKRMEHELEINNKHTRMQDLGLITTIHQRLTTHKQYNNNTLKRYGTSYPQNFLAGKRAIEENCFACSSAHTEAQFSQQCCEHTKKINPPDVLRKQDVAQTYLLRFSPVRHRKWKKERYLPLLTGFGGISALEITNEGAQYETPITPYKQPMTRLARRKKIIRRSAEPSEITKSDLDTKPLPDTAKKKDTDWKSVIVIVVNIQAVIVVVIGIAVLLRRYYRKKNNHPPLENTSRSSSYKKPKFPWIDLKLPFHRTPALVPACPQANNQVNAKFWNKFANRYLFNSPHNSQPEDPEDPEDPYLSPVDEDGQHYYDTHIDVRESNENLQRTSSVYIEPYELHMRENDCNYKSSYDCYYDYNNSSSILSDEEQRLSQLGIQTKESDYVTNINKNVANPTNQHHHQKPITKSPQSPPQPLSRPSGVPPIAAPKEKRRIASCFQVPLQSELSQESLKDLGGRLINQGIIMAPLNLDNEPYHQQQQSNKTALNDTPTSKDEKISINALIFKSVLKLSAAKGITSTSVSSKKSPIHENTNRTSSAVAAGIAPPVLRPSSLATDDTANHQVKPIKPPDRYSGVAPPEQSLVKDNKQHQPRGLAKPTEPYSSSGIAPLEQNRQGMNSSLAVDVRHHQVDRITSTSPSGIAPTERNRLFGFEEPATNGSSVLSANDKAGKNKSPSQLGLEAREAMPSGMTSDKDVESSDSSIHLEEMLEEENHRRMTLYGIDLGIDIEKFNTKHNQKQERKTMKQKLSRVARKLKPSFKKKKKMNTKKKQYEAASNYDLHESDEEDDGDDTSPADTLPFQSSSTYLSFERIVSKSSESVDGRHPDTLLPTKSGIAPSDKTEHQQLISSNIKSLPTKSGIAPPDKTAQHQQMISSNMKSLPTKSGIAPPAKTAPHQQTISSNIKSLPTKSGIAPPDKTAQHQQLISSNKKSLPIKSGISPPDKITEHQQLVPSNIKSLPTKSGIAPPDKTAQHQQLISSNIKSLPTKSGFAPPDKTAQHQQLISSNKKSLPTKSGIAPPDKITEHQQMISSNIKSLPTKSGIAPPDKTTEHQQLISSNNKKLPTKSGIAPPDKKTKRRKR